MGSVEPPSASFSAEKRAVKRTEQIWLKPNKTLRRFCHFSKNLYNEANYLVKQTLRDQGHWLRYNKLYHQLKTSPNYRALPAKSAQQTLRLLDRNWKAFFQALKSWKQHPAKFKAKPKPPHYKPKNGEYILVFTNQQVRIREGYLKFPKKIGFEMKTRLPEDTNLQEARIIPKWPRYILEIVYERDISPNERNRQHVVGIDLGVSNLVTLVNNFGETPLIIGGGVAKSINQYYNKELARLHRIYAHQGIKTGTRLKKVHNKRNRKLHDYFHKVSRVVVEWCVTHDVGTLVIGYNADWKQGVKLGKKHTQNFVQLPFKKLINQIQYKAEEHGLKVILHEESHTSKCSFLDQESIEHHEKYVGRRKSRGLFQSAERIVINADVNGAYNIIKKAIPKAFVDGIEGVGLHPERCHSIFQRKLISTDQVS